MYEYTDRIIKILNSELVRLFRVMHSKNLAKMDEITILSRTDDLYYRYYEILIRLILRLMNWSYFEYWFMYHEDADEKSKKKAKNHYRTKDVKKFLKSYNPVTKYIFNKEYERKKARLFEALISTSGDKKELDTAMRLLSRQTKWYCDLVTDKAVLDAMLDSGIKRVVWCTEEDEKVCADCYQLDGKVFNIDRIPVKPHPNCRCHVEPYRGK